MSASTSARIADVELVERGGVPAAALHRAEAKITAVARYTDEPILRVRVRLTAAPDPAVADRVRAQANLNVNGRLVRAQVAAPTPDQAISRLQRRLRRRLSGMARGWEARRGRQPAARAAGWRHGSRPSRRPAYYPRPAEQRQVVRHKTFEFARASVDEAALDLDLLDYDFHLFTEEGTGADSVLYRAGATGYRLAQVRPDPGRVPPAVVPLTVSDQPAPRLRLSEAVARLNLSGQPFLFYADPATGRGRVLYRRYDGHYGLITPTL
jgi:ribosome-associated translation inhibitor RaiA